MLAELELAHAELSVLLTNDAQIHALNRKHREKDKPTDVLSFPLDEGGGADGAVSGTRVLGDVVISLDTAARQARARKRELLPEVRFLLAHGLLHLLGYDHGDPAEKTRDGCHDSAFSAGRCDEFRETAQKPRGKPEAADQDLAGRQTEEREGQSPASRKACEMIAKSALCNEKPAPFHTRFTVQHGTREWAMGGE